MSTSGLGPSDGVAGRGLTPHVKAVIGGVLAAISLLLLLLPLPGAAGAAPSVARLARIRLAALGDEADLVLGLPLDLGYLVWRWFFVAMVLAVVLLLVALPWWRAARTLRMRPGTPGIGQDGNAEMPTEEIRRLDDGRLVGDGSSPTGWIVRTPRQLFRHAAAHRMRWHEEYESPGGARVLLDLLRAVDESREPPAPGTEAEPGRHEASRHEASRHEASRHEFAPEEPVVGDGGAGSPRASGPEIASTDAEPAGADPRAVDPVGIDPLGADAVGVAPVGSVYSSTQLYSSGPSSPAVGEQRIGFDDEGRIGLEGEARVGESRQHGERDEGNAR